MKNKLLNKQINTTSEDSINFKKILKLIPQMLLSTKSTTIQE